MFHKWQDMVDAGETNNECLKSSQSSCPPHIEDGTVIINDTDQTNIMNEYFANQSKIDT